MNDYLMNKRVTIIMYHFVRDLMRSRYPKIKGLNLSDFKEQLEFIKKSYTPISFDDLLAAARVLSTNLPKNAALLTFDDGYIDHFTNVFPLLDKAGIKGAFFPSAKAIQEHKVLDVNKIHFVLASVQEPYKIIQEIFDEINAYRFQYTLESPEYYYEKLAIPNRYDTAEVVFVKRILQRELPESFRNQIVDKLFRRFVTCDEEAFSAELYMTTDQLSCLHRNGMHLGSHGYDHYWLNTLSLEEQEKEIILSLDFLVSLGCRRTDWAMCYPYGSCDEKLKTLLKEHGCSIGFGTDVAVADLSSDDPLYLPRLDTNDIPVS
jgi:peptidoglycan/xylan/chitin deacetylase (PgdA/CDA1 family)